LFTPAPSSLFARARPSFRRQAGGGYRNLLKTLKTAKPAKPTCKDLNNLRQAGETEKRVF